MTAVLPPPTTPGRIEVDSGTPCGAPACGLPLDQHNGKPYHVNGVPVGSADCARALSARRHVVTVPVKPCCREVLRGEPCGCVQAADLATAPTIRIRARGAR